MPAFVKVGAVFHSNTSYFLSLADSLEEWRSLTSFLGEGSFDEWDVEEVVGPVRAQWWNALWLPLTSDGGGSCACLDLDPPEGGAVGQVISFWHDYPSREVASPDLPTFLLEHVEEDEWAASHANHLRLN